MSEPAAVLRDSPVEAAPPERCAACGEALAGPFCHACGERRPRPTDERLAPFLREQLHEATSADGKLWRSLKALFVPGKLTEEYFSGRRRLYVRPVRLFLVGNLFFFFMLTFTASNSIFQGRAEGNRTGGAYGRWATERLAEAAASAGVTQEAYDAAFDRQAETLSTTLVFSLVPGLALTLAALLFWTGASGLRHFVFSTHYVAFAMAGSVVVAAVWIPVQVGFQFLGRYGVPDPIGGSLDPLLFVMFIVYLVLALRRAYRVGWLASVAVTSGVIVLGGWVILQAFKTLLFAVTLWTVDVPA